MDNIQQINDRLMELRLNMKEKDKAERMLRHEDERAAALISRIEKLKEQLDKENMDVEKLEKTSLSKFYHIIRGNLTETKRVEEQEAWDAKVKYETVMAELNDVRERINAYKKTIRSFSDAEYKYNSLLEEKEHIIKSSPGKAAKQLEQVHNQLIDLSGNRKEVDEALNAGQQLMLSLRRVREHLDSARNWGAFDVMGGGFISTAIKHNHLDDASSEINRAHSLLRSFQRELSDLGDSISIQIDISEFLRFADYFFDGLFADLSVQSRIRESLEQTDDAIGKVSGVITKLQVSMADFDRQIKSLEAERIKIVEVVD